MGIIISLSVLGAIGAVGALLLYVVARRFYVYEDPRISDVEAFLPGANCGACGKNGCHDFACACVEAGALDGLYCPGAGEEGMSKIAKCLGCDAVSATPMIAVLKCAGTAETKQPLDAKYVGPSSCAIMNLTAGDYECINSCLGCGDCVAACKFGAIKIDASTGLPIVEAEKCTGCGACAQACPRSLILIRNRGRNNRRVWVACSNCAKGALARKQCSVACIGCGICVRTCPFEAITLNNNHAYIDYDKCKACGKCVPVCPQKSIHSVNIKIVNKNEAKDI